MFKIISHITLSLIFLVSTIGFSMNVHYCQDKLYDIAFYSQAESCCNDMSHHHNHCSTEKENNHCKDEHIQFQIDKDYTFETLHFDNSSSQFVLLFLENFILLDLVNQSENIQNVNYYTDISPPDTKTYLSLIQSYLL